MLECASTFWVTLPRGSRRDVPAPVRGDANQVATMLACRVDDALVRILHARDQDFRGNTGGGLGLASPLDVLLGLVPQLFLDRLYLGGEDAGALSAINARSARARYSRQHARDDRGLCKSNAFLDGLAGQGRGVGSNDPLNPPVLLGGSETAHHPAREYGEHDGRQRGRAGSRRAPDRARRRARRTASLRAHEHDWITRR